MFQRKPACQDERKLKERETGRNRQNHKEYDDRKEIFVPDDRAVQIYPYDSKNNADAEDTVDSDKPQNSEIRRVEAPQDSLEASVPSLA